MLPSFDEYGNSPSGIHVCEIDTLCHLFGSDSPARQVETQELIEFIDWARKAGVERLLINGSYVTSKRPTPLRGPT